MTGRFSFHLDKYNPYKWNVYDRDKFVCQNDYKRGAKNISDCLNALHERNRQLKKRLNEKDHLLKQQLIINENLSKRIKELEDD